MDQNTPSYKVLQPLILAATIAVGMMFGYKLNEKPEINLVSKHDFPKDSINYTGRVEELIRFIETKYVDTIHQEKLLDAAVQAILAKLDPHSVYMNPTETSDQNDEMNGKYYGIGVENYFIDDTVRISKIIEGGPAFQAGLRVFDKMIMIDGDTVAGKKLSYESIRKKLKKKQGHDVVIKIMRNGKLQDVTIQVGEVKVRTVHSTLIPEIETALIRIDKFGTNTYKEFMEEVEKWFGPNKAKNVILDLRNNPGGYLPEAINILSQIFKEKDKLLLYTVGKSGKRNEYKSTGKYFFNIEQVVVLINEESASASEIIAGALQDLDRGIIIGRRSFGKGLVQEQYPLNNGGAIRLTVSRYYTPSGRSIQKDYSNPNIYATDTEDSYAHYEDTTSTKKDVKYYTKIFKREVPGGGGITPDIFIGNKSTKQDSISSEAYQLLPEFAFKYLSQNPELLKAGINAVHDNEKYKAAFEVYMTSRLGADFVKNNKHQASIHFEEFKDQIERILLKINDYDTSTFSKEDKFIQTSISTIKDNKSPKAFTPLH